MFLALALFLVQPHVHLQLGFSVEKTALIQPATVSDADSASFIEISLPLTQPSYDVATQPETPPASAELPTAPVAAMLSSPARAAAFIRPGNPLKVSVQQLQTEEREKRRMWLGLGIAEHSAATFDAWTTRRAITHYDAHEMNPLLKPFAGNASLYAAIQVGPVALDYLSRRMLDSKHGWVRNMWWLPQSASTVSSLFCGVHNLGVR